MQARIARSKGTFVRNAAIATCAALFGGGVAFLSDVHVFPFWFDLGWRQPVANWIMAIGLGDAIAAYWNNKISVPHAGLADSHAAWNPCRTPCSQDVVGCQPVLWSCVRLDA